MTQALRQLFEDFLSAILFFAVYGLTGSLGLGVGVAIAVGIGQVLRLRLLRRRVAAMQWMSLALVIVLGGATVLLDSPRLLMMKPSAAHLAIAAIMLRRGWMQRYLPLAVQQRVGESAIAAAGYAWAALLASLGIANLIIAAECEVATWAWFISVGAGGAKIAALGVQYAVFRAIARRRGGEAVPGPTGEGSALGPATAE
jgi:intracellular septation protein A